ncbi:lasso peptide biosynthesis B2 protein [Gordonia terrae]|uniref:lasso peptide biosynthesis B2 protein n=1 Tax=Gordonia terrae TaxID=2055 RepID=UPI003F6D1B7A
MIRPDSWALDARATIAAARLLSRSSPRTLERVLRLASRGAQTATTEIATRAHSDVVDSSIGMAGPNSCLPRSISVALLCRLRGYWPRWCVGVRTHPPFAAHAWVEAEGHVVGEFAGPNAYQSMISVQRP